MPEPAVILALPAPAFGARVIASPFQFYSDGDDNLRLEGWSSVAGVSLVLSLRFVDAKGVLTAYARTLALTSDRTKSTLMIPLGKGYLVNIVLVASGTATKIGQVFTSVKLIHGLSGATIVIGLLLQAYVTSEQGLGWPGSPITDSISGGGVLRFVEGTDPAAGVEISETVPTGARWELLDARFTLTTDATVSARRSGLVLDDGTTNYFRSPQPATIGAGQAVLNYWAQGFPLTTAILSDVPIAGIPDHLQLQAGHRIRSASNNLQAGDNYAAPVLLVREWLEIEV